MTLAHYQDVRSFEPDGQERLLEIKTTFGHERTSFWLTRREMDVAVEKSDVYTCRLAATVPTRSPSFLQKDAYQPSGNRTSDQRIPLSLAATVLSVC